jgi:ATP-dependent DNA helicase PIF1
LTGDEVETIAFNDLLHAINNTLEDSGKTNSSFGIDMPSDTEDNEEMFDEADFDPQAQSFFDECSPLLNEDQQSIFDTIKTHIDNEEGRLYSIDAPGGSGKTFLANVILAYVRKDNHIAFAMAMSGIAATLLKLGTTFHRRIGVPIPCMSDSSSRIKLNSKQARLIRECIVFIIDEVSMMNFKLLDLLDRFLRELMGNNEYMGGKLVILMHDFRQILPVVPQGRRADIMAAAVINSKIWTQFKPLRLRQNMRVHRMLQLNTSPDHVHKLQEYSNWLLDLGDGKLPSAVPNVLGIIQIPNQMVCKSDGELEDKVFENFLQYYDDPQYLQTRAIMSSTNDIIQQKNFEMVKRLPGEMVISNSIDSCVEDEHVATYDAEVLNRINASGIPPHRLALKPGACIILIKNLNISHGHCNGTRYIIKELTPRLIKAEKLCGGPHSEILIPRIPMISKDTDFLVPFKRLQFPVLLAYYLTLNRAQGQSLDRAGIYLPKSVFSHGHLYVGCSRCGDPNSVFIYADQNEFDGVRQYLMEGTTYTHNIVYPEIFPM